MQIQLTQVSPSKVTPSSKVVVKRYFVEHSVIFVSNQSIINFRDDPLKS
jgi:hypothetical protein